MECLCGPFNLEIYLYTLNISILYTQTADAFKVGLQGLTLALIVSEKLNVDKYMKKISDCSN